MILGLPKTVEVAGRDFDVRYDFRAIIDIIIALNDPELSEQERAFLGLYIFYPAFDEIPRDAYDEAWEKLAWFIDMGDESARGKKSPRLMDWEQDYQRIIAPVNRIAGCDVRSIDYDYENNTGGLHWWTFLGYYMEIGDCLFAQIVRIRNLRARGKPLDKADRAWYRQNRDLVELKQTYTDAEDELLRQWGKGSE